VAGVLGHLRERNRARVTANLTVGSESKASADAAMIEAARGKLPKNDASVGGECALGRATADPRALVIEWSAAGKASEADFFSLHQQTIRSEGRDGAVAGCGWENPDSQAGEQDRARIGQ